MTSYDYFAEVGAEELEKKKLIVLRFAPFSPHSAA